MLWCHDVEYVSIGKPSLSEKWSVHRNSEVDSKVLQDENMCEDYLLHVVRVSKTQQHVEAPTAPQQRLFIFVRVRNALDKEMPTFSTIIRKIGKFLWRWPWENFRGWWFNMQLTVSAHEERETERLEGHVLNGSCIRWLIESSVVGWWLLILMCQHG